VVSFSQSNIPNGFESDRTACDFQEQLLVMLMNFQEQMDDEFLGLLVWELCGELAASDPCPEGIVHLSH